MTTGLRRSEEVLGFPVAARKAAGRRNLVSLLGHIFRGDQFGARSGKRVPNSSAHLLHQQGAPRGRSKVLGDGKDDLRPNHLRTTASTILPGPRHSGPHQPAPEGDTAPIRHIWMTRKVGDEA